jgi:hypothetical protein
MARGGRGRSGPKRGPLARLNPSPQVYYGDPIGVASGADYIWGTHAATTFSAEGLKSRIFASVAAVVVTAVPALIVAPQQAYADVNQSSVFEPLSGRQGPTVRAFVGGPLQVDLTQQGWIAAPIAARQGPVPPLRQGAPQVVDLTQQADLSSPLTTPQGRVPPLTLGSPQADPSQLAARLTPSQPAAPITPNPIAGFFSVPPQTEERPTRAVWPSQSRRQDSGAHCPDEGRAAALRLHAAGGPNLAVVYAGRGLILDPVVVRSSAVGRPDAAGLGVWHSSGSPRRRCPRQSGRRKQIRRSSQPTGIHGLRPLIFGRVPALLRGGQPQFNPYQIPAALGTPLEKGIGQASLLRTYAVQLQERALALQPQARILSIAPQDRALAISPQDRGEGV